jgi:hypothetical protein
MATQAGGLTLHSVYIGHDTRWASATKVAEYSLRHFVSSPVDVRLLHSDTMPSKPGARTQFSFFRFLIPHLMQYQGYALYVDQDVLFLDDVAKLFAEAPAHDDWAVACVQHTYKSIVRCPNWASVMLLNCKHLKQWTLEAYHEKPREWFHEFESVDSRLIVPLHPRWNRLDYLHEDTGLLHYTSGLPIDAKKVGERPHGVDEARLWREWEAKCT